MGRKGRRGEKDGGGRVDGEGDGGGKELGKGGRWKKIEGRGRKMGEGEEDGGRGRLVFVGVFAVVFFEEVADVEVEGFGGGMAFVVFFLDVDDVVVGFFVALAFDYAIAEVDDVVFVAWVDYVDGVVGVGAGAGGYDGLNEVIESVLPDGGFVYFSAGTECVDEEVDLREVEGCVFECCLGVVDDGVEFGACVFVFVI